MNIDFKSFKMFTPDTAEAWGRKNYGSWLPMLQSQSYEPQTPAEEFFRNYTQGAPFTNGSRSRIIFLTISQNQVYVGLKTRSSVLRGLLKSCKALIALLVPRLMRSLTH